MATTQNTYTGNGSTTAFSFTFPYLEVSDIKVSLDAVDTTAYTLSNATTIAFTTAPAVGAAIRIYRKTNFDNLNATFYPGSAIRSSDLNNNFTQNLYVTQESDRAVSIADATANSAVTTANNADASATAAVSTANTASTNATSAVNTANQAASDATYAVTQSNNAVSTASSAQSVATAASSAVSQALLFTLVANVASIPSSPIDGDSIEVGDSTTIENFVPLSGAPAGYVGAAGLSVRIRWNEAGSTWVWLNYFANDTETRYLKRSLPQVYGDATNGSGKLQLNCENNSHGVKIQGPPHSAAANYTLTLPNTTGTNGQALVTDGAGQLDWNTVDKAVIELTDFAYEPSGNTITLNSNNDPTSPFGYDINGASNRLFYNAGNSTITSNLGSLVVGDVVQFYYIDADNDWNQYDAEVLVAPVLSTSAYTYEIKFDLISGEGSSYVTITSPKFSNGFNTLSDNKILKYKTATGKWTVGDEDMPLTSLSDFAYKPSSNSITFAISGSRNVPGEADWDFLANYDYRVDLNLDDSDPAIYNLVSQIADDDSMLWEVTFGDNTSSTYTVTSMHDYVHMGSSNYGRIRTNEPVHLPPGKSISDILTLKITTASIINGVEALENDQVVKYKSATGKWTVEDPHVINKNSISSDLTISNNHNSSFMGPITINSGINIIVGSNSKFTVLN